MGTLNDLAGRRVYLDTNVFIYGFENPASSPTPVSRLFQMSDAGEFEAVSSELALAELLVRPLREGNLDLVRTYRTLFLQRHPLTVEAVDRRILLRAAQLRAEAGLRLPDAIHLSTALTQGCDLVLTNDTRMRNGSPIPIWLLSELR